jgi:excisionase family DNA binding protein
MKTYTMAQVAEQIGVSRQTLHSWIKVGHVTAPKATGTNKRSYRLWIQADIERVREFKGTLKRGRKKFRYFKPV